jgi:colanic acid/amylovoran biosynthesis glycosyltransferase
MLEAMASGLPVFATRHGGIPEAIENKVSGILVNEHDDCALGDALIDCAKDSARLVAMGRAASESVAKNFNQTEQTRRLEEIYLRQIAS